MQATVRELKKRNRKAVNIIKQRLPPFEGEITFHCTTVKPLMQRAQEVTNWMQFQSMGVN